MSTLTVAFLCVIASVSVSANDSLNNVLFDGMFEFIDLTHPFDNNTVYWPNAKTFEFTKQVANFRDSGTGYAANDFSAGEHGGTHVDAPYHFLRTGNTVGQLPLEKLIVPLIVIDVSIQTHDDPDFVLHKSHLDNKLNNNDGKRCVIIFKFGWSKYFSNRDKYLGIRNSDSEHLSFPGLSAEVGEWIAKDHNNVVGVGVDTASVDPGSSTNFAVHQVLAKYGLYNLEHVKLDRHMPENGCTALVMPMKIQEGTGAPLRLVAICPKQDKA